MRRLDLGAETRGARRGIHGVEAALAVGPQAVADAIIASEVRRGFGRRDDVIGRQRIFRMRQADLDDLGARVAKPFDALVPQGVDVGGHAVDPIFLGNTDALAFEIARQSSFPIRHRQVERGRILRVEAGHGLEHDRAVADGPRHRPGLVERAGEGHDAPARAAAVGRLDPADAGEGRRLADRAAGVGAGRRGGDARRDCRRRTARRPARSKRGIAAVVAPPRRDHRAVGAGLVRRAHGELVHVELAEHARPRLAQVGGDGALIARLEVLEDAAAGGRIRLRAWRTDP